MGYFITEFTGYSSSHFVFNLETASDNKTTHSCFSWFYHMKNNIAVILKVNATEQVVIKWLGDHSTLL